MNEDHLAIVNQLQADGRGMEAAYAAAYYGLQKAALKDRSRIGQAMCQGAIDRAAGIRYSWPGHDWFEE